MKNGIRAFFRRYRKSLTCFSIIAFIVIPLIINLVFKHNSGISWLEAEWSAGDVLSFYGSILAAGIGIVGVFFSIQHAQKSYQEDARNQVRPYLTIIRLRGNSNYNIFWDLLPSQNEEQESEKRHEIPCIQYEETKLKSIYIVIEENDIKFQTKLSNEDEEILRKKGRIQTFEPGGVSVVTQKFYMSMPMQVENVGNGPAVNTKIGFWKDGSPESYIEPTQLKKGDIFYIHIFSKVPSERIKGDYTLGFIYWDIYQNKYIQKYPFAANKDGYMLNMDVKQIMVN